MILFKFCRENVLYKYQQRIIWHLVLRRLGDIEQVVHYKKMFLIIGLKHLQSTLMVQIDACTRSNSA